MQTVTVPAKTFEKMLSRLDQLAVQVEAIKKKLEGAPIYGSDAWWERSNKKALESIKKGKGTVVNNKKELDVFFQNLANE